MEVFLFVMLRLARDVFLDGFFLRFADGEDGITFLPSEIAEGGAGQSHLIPHKKAKNGLARFVVPACLQALLLDAAFGRFVLPQ